MLIQTVLINISINNLHFLKEFILKQSRIVGTYIIREIQSWKKIKYLRRKISFKFNDFVRINQIK